MKYASLLGLLTTGGIVATGEIAYYSLSSNLNKIEESLAVSEPELSTTQLTHNTVSLNESKEIIPASTPQPTSTPRVKAPPNEKEKLIEKIKDYTVKIVCVSSSSGFGTGWFLDHEIRDDGSYPLKWFLATNVHSLDGCAFPEDTYGQNPKIKKTSQDSSALFLYRWESGGYDEEIFKNKNIDFEEPSFWSSEWNKHHKPYKGSLPQSRNAETKSDEEWNKKKEIPSMHIKIPDAKLLYSALDNLKDSDDNPIYTFMDFAVVEINFPSEESAKRMTKQVYEKKDDERINFVGKVKEGSEFYTAGFPNNSYNPYRPVGNYSATQDRASQKSGCQLFTRINIQKRGEISYINHRCYHELNNFYSRKGSSGSMIVDENGTLLGLHTIGHPCRKLSYTQPIRAEKKDCSSSGSQSCKEQREYDLIVGSDSQTTSYKEQLLKHLPNINTYLKNKHNWGTTSPEAQI